MLQSRKYARRLTNDFNRNTSPNGDAAEGKAIIEKIFLGSWNDRWASAEEMGDPLVAIGSQIFSYMSGRSFISTMA